MSDVQAIVNHANAMLAQMRQLSQEAAGVDPTHAADFSQILQQVMSASEATTIDQPVSLAQNVLMLTQETVSVDAMNRVYHAAIQAYQEIENMQI